MCVIMMKCIVSLQFPFNLHNVRKFEFFVITPQIISEIALFRINLLFLLRQLDGSFMHAPLSSLLYVSVLS